MSETIALNQSLGWINIGSSGIRLRASGLTGNVTWRPPDEHPPFMAASLLPGAAAVPDLIEQAIQEAGLNDHGSITLPSGTASIAGPPDQLVFDGPTTQDPVEFAIYRDESGVISLHRPISTTAQPVAALLAGAAAPPASRSHRYTIPMRHAATPTGGVPLMAMLGGIGGKVIRFVGRAVTGLTGDVVFVAAKTWEDKFRAAQGAHWGGTPNDLLAASPIAMPPTDPHWATLQAGKSLLFIHGTISSTLGGYIGLQNFPTLANTLFNSYSGRVIGFNHHTLTKTVPQNAVDFLSGMPPGNYQFDIISHSRGGLVARALKEFTPAQLGQMVEPIWAPPGNVNVQIGKVVMVGTPNQGTPLANPTDLPKAVSRLASITSSFSQGAAEVGLGALFAIFGAIIEGGLGALPGLGDMNPGNPFLRLLNASSDDITPYYGIEADFQPTGGLATAIENNGVDALFLGAENDLVVPTLGVSQLNGQTLPGLQVDTYPPDRNVYHTDYFYQLPTWNSILGFL